MVTFQFHFDLAAQGPPSYTPPPRNIALQYNVNGSQASNPGRLRYLFNRLQVGFEANASESTNAAVSSIC